MRILAIRGANLASLADEFEIDLTREPLAGAGLFAITGDTGAGKSTILDALCLALYGEFPRVAIDRREYVQDPSGKDLTVKDARAILRRGASQGHAEVDFVGQDGKGYRARWEVRRARGKADGNLQNAERRLDSLDDGSSIATGQTDVLRAVEARTELTFDQFRRTVLLAQGEFDAFLLAAENERAELLEKITGTDIYARVSKRVNAGTKEREARTQMLEQRRADIGLMDDEVRAKLVSEQAERSSKAALKSVELKELTERLNHAERLQDAREGARRAETGLAEARERLDVAKDDVARLQRLDAVEPLRSKAETEKLAGLRLAEARRQVELCEEAVRQSEQKAAAAARALNGAKEAFEKADAEVEKFTPLWREAEQTDTQIVNAANESKAAQEAAEQARRQADARTADLAKIEAQRVHLSEQHTQALQKLEARAAHASLADRLEDINSRLDQRSKLRQREATAKHELAVASKEDARLQPLIAAAEEKIARYAERRSEISVRLRDRRLALAQIDEPTLAKRDKGLREGLELLREARDAARKHGEAEAAISNAEAERLVQEAALAEAAETIRKAQLQQADLSARRSEVSGLFELAEKSQSQQALALRSVLIAGEPCPVCGASEHPFTDGGHAEAEMVAQMRARRAELDRDIAAAAKAITTGHGEEERARARLDVAHRRVEEAAVQSAAAREKFETLVPALRQFCADENLTLSMPSSLDVRTTASLDALGAEAAAIRDSLSEPLSQAVALRSEIDALRNKLDEISRDSDGVAEQIKTDKDAQTQTRWTLGQLETQLASLDEQITTLSRDLTPYLKSAGLTLDDLDRDAAQVQQHIAQLATSFAKLRDECKSLESELQQLEPRLVEMRLQCEAAKSRMEVVQATQSDRERRLQEAKAARAPLLEGEATDAHRARITRAAQAAKAALSAAQEANSAADKTHATCKAQHGTLLNSVENYLKELSAAKEILATAIAGTGMTHDDVSSLLAVPQEERNLLRDRIEAVQRSVREAETALVHRRQDVARLFAEREEETDIAAVTAAVTTLNGAIEEIRNRLAAIQAELNVDDQARANAADISRQLEAEREDFATWKRVDDAIGSADGNKFRRFAQGVTLDQLVHLANAQIKGLNPRYQLARATTSDLALHVIDRDMGDEVRSLRSLSGGERFLVSLGLALALSGLEGRQSFVDTLFIDEGFGALDAETLDMAIDALETLQGHGRKVGVITHVAAMVDRIAVQIRVEKRGGGRGVVHIVDAGVGDAGAFAAFG